MSSKAQFVMAIFIAIISIVGAILLWAYADWHVAAGISLLLWGNHLEKRLPARWRFKPFAD